MDNIPVFAESPFMLNQLLLLEPYDDYELHLTDFSLDSLGLVYRNPDRPELKCGKATIKVIKIKHTAEGKLISHTLFDLPFQYGYINTDGNWTTDIDNGMFEVHFTGNPDYIRVLKQIIDNAVDYLNEICHELEKEIKYYVKDEAFRG